MYLSNFFWFLVLWIGAIGVNILLFAYLSAKYKTPSYLIAGIASYIVLANILSYKLIQIWKFVVPAGVVAYSMIFLIGDILSEAHGKKYAQYGVYAGFLMNVMFVILIYLALISPPLSTPQGLEKQQNFEEVFGLTSRIILASIIAFIISQSLNVFLFHTIKSKTKGKHLWLRNNLSTMISQLVDTIIFISIAFMGVVPTNIVYNMMLTQYLLKVIIALSDTPFLYFGMYIYNRTINKK